MVHGLCCVLYQWSRCFNISQVNPLQFPLWTISEIHCTSHDDCSSQKACINSLCVDPCFAANPCDASQECQVLEHQPVCIKVCQCQKQTDCRTGTVCNGCNCIIREFFGFSVFDSHIFYMIIPISQKKSQK